MSQNEEIVRSMIAGAPYGRLLGIEIVSIEPDRVRLRLPFRQVLVTIADVVHGGAIASLVDATATAAVWSAASLEGTPRGTTIGFTVNFLAAARGEDVLADARVIQRGRTISVCDVEVTGARGKSVARALVTYKLG